MKEKLRKVPCALFSALFVVVLVFCFDVGLNKGQITEQAFRKNYFKIAMHKQWIDMGIEHTFVKPDGSKTYKEYMSVAELLECGYPSKEEQQRFTTSVGPKAGFIILNTHCYEGEWMDGSLIIN